MFKIFFKITLACFLLLVFVAKPLSAEAVNVYQLDTMAKVTQYNTSGKTANVESIAQTILKVTLSILGILFLAFAIYGGMRWMTAQGNEEYVTKAKDTLEAAIIGLAVVASAYAITNLIFGLVGTGGTNNTNGESSETVNNPGAAGSGCNQNNDCDSGVCGPELKCLAPEDTCSTDSDCEAEGKCIGGVCQSTEGSASDKCEEECGAGEYCSFDGICKTGCAKDADCTDGKICMPGLNICEFPTNIGTSCGPGGIGKCGFANNPPAGFGGGQIDDYFSGENLCGKNVGVKCFFPTGKCASNSQCDGICNSSTHLCDNSKKGKCLKNSSNTWVESGFNVCVPTGNYQSCTDAKASCNTTKAIEFGNCQLACDNQYNWQTQSKQLATCNKKCDTDILAGMGITTEYCNHNYIACIQGSAISP